jgi:hypothetical protein
MCADRPSAPAAHHVTGVALIALSKDHLARGQPAWNRHLGDLSEIIRTAGVEDRHAMKQADRVHGSGIPQRVWS